MKYAIFVVFSRINFILLNKIRMTAEMLSCITNMFTSSLLKIIDSDRMKHATSAVEQNQEILELQVLSHIFDVRNDAVKRGQWDEDHEGKLNFLGNLLCNEYDWEVEEVERYLYEVIETGPAVNKED